MSWPCTRDQARSGGRSSPHLLSLPAPRAADAGLLDAQVELLDVFLLEQPRAGVFHHDAADLQHIAVARAMVQRHVGVLLDQQHRHAALPVDAHDDVEDLLHQLGRQAERRLVQQHHRRAAPSAPG